MSRVDHPIIPAVDDPAASVSQRYLSLLADVAQQLLAAASAATMVDELFALIRRELRLDVFFNYRMAGDRLVLAAHGGLSTDEAERGAELGLGQAVCGCVARDRQAHHATAVQASDDPMVAFVKGMGLDAYACTPLIHGDRLLGTLGFGRRWADRFTPDELSFIQTICHYVALAKYRLQVEEELRRGVAVRERLLAELNHRVRNALQAAIGVVGMEVGVADPAARAPLLRVLDRLQVLALAHRPLYASDRPDTIDVARLLTGLVEEASEGASIGRLAHGPAVPIETAAALALLVHSILAARTVQSPVVVVMDAPDGRNSPLVIAFHGLAPLPTTAAPTTLRLVAALLRQLRASITPATGALHLSLPYAPADE